MNSNILAMRMVRNRIIRRAPSVFTPSGGNSYNTMMIHDHHQMISNVVFGRCCCSTLLSSSVTDVVLRIGVGVRNIGTTTNIFMRQPPSPSAIVTSASSSLYRHHRFLSTMTASNLFHVSSRSNALLPLRDHPTIKSTLSCYCHPTSCHDTTRNRTVTATTTMMSRRDRSRTTTTTTNNNKKKKQKTALIIGSSGSLGSFLSHYLATQHDMFVIGADIVTSSSSDHHTSHDHLHGFIPLPSPSPQMNLTSMTIQFMKGLRHVLLSKQQQQAMEKQEVESPASWDDIEDSDDENGENENKIDVIICASGGWKNDFVSSPSLSIMDDETDDDMIQHHVSSYMNVFDEMIQKNLYPTILCSYFVQNHHDLIHHQGLCIMVGATAAIQPTPPPLLAYGTTKSATHHIISSLGIITDKGMSSPKQRYDQKKQRMKSTTTTTMPLPQQVTSFETLCVIGLLPTTLDTISNRRAMLSHETAHSSNDQEIIKTWTKPNDIATEIATWIDTPSLRPHSGCLIKIKTRNHITSFELVQ